MIKNIIKAENLTAEWWNSRHAILELVRQQVKVQVLSPAPLGIKMKVNVTSSKGLESKLSVIVTKKEIRKNR